MRTTLTSIKSSTVTLQTLEVCADLAGRREGGSSCLSPRLRSSIAPLLLLRLPTLHEPKATTEQEGPEAHRGAGERVVEDTLRRGGCSHLHVCVAIAVLCMAYSWQSTG